MTVIKKLKLTNHFGQPQQTYKTNSNTMQPVLSAGKRNMIYFALVPEWLKKQSMFPPELTKAVALHDAVT